MPSGLSDRRLGMYGRRVRIRAQMLPNAILQRMCCRCGANGDCSRKSRDEPPGLSEMPMQVCSRVLTRSGGEE